MSDLLVRAHQVGVTLKLVLLVVISTGCASGLSTANPHALIEHTLSDVPEDTRVAVARLTPEYTLFYGFTYQDGQWQAEENHHSAFELGSITKLYTAFLTVELAQQLPTELEATIGELIPTLQPNEAVASITLEQLLTHSSGLPFVPTILTDMPQYDSNPFAEFDRESLEHYLQTSARSHDSEFIYSNLGYATLGLAIEALGDESYATLLNDYVLAPLELEQTSVERSQMQSTLVTGRNRDGSPASYWDFAAFTPSGGLYATILDTACFIRLQLEPSHSSATQMQTIHRNHSGLGWTKQHQDGRQWLEQTGATGGFSHAVMLQPDSQDAVIVLSNLSGVGPHAIQVIELAQRLLN